MSPILKGFFSATLLPVLIILFFVFVTDADASPPSSTKQPETLSQQEWLRQFQGFFVTGLCEKKDYVSTCFGSSVSECRLAVSENIPACKQGVHLPAQIQIGKDSEHWGEQMGRCLSPKLVHQKVSSIQKRDAKCAQLANW